MTEIPDDDGSARGDDGTGRGDDGTARTEDEGARQSLAGDIAATIDPDIARLDDTPEGHPGDPVRD